MSSQHTNCAAAVDPLSAPHSAAINVTTAYALHQAGRYADAARVYQAVLDADPDNASALHLFGVMHQQCGHLARAAELIQRAIDLRPEEAAYHANLAESERSLGRHHEAAASCRTALALEPNHPAALNNLGLALHELGRYEEAVAEFNAALSQRPDFAQAQNNRGTSLQALGKIAEAEQAFRSALDLEPTLGQAHANLGQILADQGLFAEGLSHCRDAVRHQPDLAAGHNNLGNVLRALERWAEAEAAFAEAIQLEPKLAIAYANLGFVQQRQGKPAAALQNVQCAAAINPDDPEILRQLAAAQCLAEDWPAAVATCRKRLALLPDDAGAHNDLGWACQSDGRQAEAEVAYHRALQLAPDHLDARLNLGSLQEELGAMVEAEACYHQAQQRQPLSPLPLARRATLLRGRLPQADRDRLRFELYRPHGPELRLNLLFALAHVADATGDPAEAAACLEPANALARELRERCGQAYEADEHTRYVDRLISAFTPEVFRRLAAVGDPTARPVFVCGLPRSGTTLVEQILASHAQVFGAGELPLGRRAMDDVPAAVDQPADMTACLEALDARALGKLARGYQDAVNALVERTAPLPIAPTRIVDKMPENYLYLGLLAVLFPNATLIHVGRDERDVAVSCWLTHFRAIRWADDQSDFSAAHRRSSATDGSLAGRTPPAGPRGLLRAAGRRFRGGGEALGAGLWPGVATGLPRVS